MLKVQTVTASVKSIIPDNAHIRNILRMTNGTWVGLHGMKSEMRNLCLQGSAEENLLVQLSKKLQELRCKILTVPETEKGILPAMPNDPFAKRTFYLVRSDYSTGNVKNYVKLHESSNSSLSRQDIEIMLRQLEKPQWVQGADIVNYQKALTEREKILNSKVATCYKCDEDVRRVVRGLWEQKMAKSKPIAISKSAIISAKSVPIPVIIPQKPAAKPEQRLWLGIPKSVSDVCEKTMRKSSFKKYASQLRELRDKFPNERLQFIENKGDFYLTTNDNKLKEKVLEGTVSFPKDIKHLVENLENIFKHRNEKALEYFANPQKALTYNA